MILYIKFHEILFISSRATLATNFLSHTHRQTDRQAGRHFRKIVKSCSGHPKTCKSIENWKSKICPKPILSSTYIEEEKMQFDIYINEFYRQNFQNLQIKHATMIICVIRNTKLFVELLCLTKILGGGR